MRLLELRLKAYGPFTGVALDLSAADPGFHLIFGPNEAGKSAALRALRGLFYGIPAGTGDAFLHEPSELRIGAVLERSGGDRLAFDRRKGRKNTIVHPETGAALPDDVLVPFLGNADEGTFSRLYGIGHDELVEGGKTLAATRGLAGESLFAAGLGGAALAAAQTFLLEEVNAFYPDRGGDLRDLLKKLRRALDDRKEKSKRSAQWEELREERETTERRRDELARQIERLRAEKGRVEQHLLATELLRERKVLRAQIDALGEGRVLPSSYDADRRRDATRCLFDLRPKIEIQRRKLDGTDGLRARIAAVVVHEEVLRQADVIESLRESLGAYRETTGDLPNREAERNALLLEATRLLAELRPGAPLADADALRLAPDRKDRIRKLAAVEGETRAGPGRFEEEETDKTREIGSCNRDLDLLGPPMAAEPLERSLRRVRKLGDLEERLANAESQWHGETEEALRALERLGLGRGALDEVDRLPLPSVETVNRFVKDFASLEAERLDLQRSEGELERRAAATSREIEVLQESGDVPSELALLEGRRRREVGWKLVRCSWIDGREDADAVRSFAGDEPLADAYEASVRDADVIADRLRREADRVAKLAGLRGEEKGIAKDREAAGEKWRLLTGRADELTSEWRAAWVTAGIHDPLPPGEMRAWMAKHEDLVRRVSDLRARSSQIEDLGKQIASSKQVLSSQLSALGEPMTQGTESLADLVDRCEKIVARVQDANRARSDLGARIRKLEDELAAVRDDRTRAESSLRRWEAAWAAAVQTIGCDAGASGSEVTARLDRINDLVVKLDRIRDLEQRIRGMQSRARDFERRVSDIVHEVAPDLATLGAQEAVGEAQRRLDQARESAVLLASLRKEETQRADELAADVEECEGQQAVLEELCRLADVRLPEELEAAEARSRHRQRWDEIEQRLGHLAGGQPIEEFAGGAEDEHALAARRERLEAQIQAEEAQRRALDQSIGEVGAKMKLFDGSGDAAEAEEVVLGLKGQIRRGADRYVRVRVALAFLERQIERHRAATQDPILTRAGELFATLTCGAFAGLRTDHDERDNPIVVGIRPGDGAVLGVQGMSDGTRDQLYLSLRLAYLEKQLERQEPLPFVVDDILVNFDDERACATLRALGDLSRRARVQILLFTHHERNIDLAKKAVPTEELVVHHLEGRSTRR